MRLFPSMTISDHGIEDGDELAHAGGDGDLLVFAGGNEALCVNLSLDTTSLG